MDTRTSEPFPEQASAASTRPRVLHVLASLGLGGVETWLMHMLRHRDRFSVDHEILLTKEEPGEYEAEVRRMGVPIHKLPIGPGKRAWLQAFRRFLKANGPYDAVHSHVYLFSAPVLAAAKSSNVPIRIAHCHTARSRGSDYQTLRHKLRRSAAILWLKRVATRRIGISDAAIEEIAGAGWRDDPRSAVLLYGFDFSRYRGAAQRATALRHQLAIDGQAPVVGHVGRFEEVKNHRFLLEAFAGVREAVPAAQLVLVGDGPTRRKVESQAAELGIVDCVHFAGTTDDVPAYMRVFNLFALPSFSEGLGIVVVEAQAAGTPAIVSDAVPAEACVIPGAVEFMPLSAGPKSWAAAMAKVLQPQRPHSDEWLAKVEQSAFGIDRCITELDQIYRSEMARVR